VIAAPDADSLELYRQILDDVVGEMHCVDDGRIALARIIGSPPDLVITDTHLPMLDGFELCELLRRESATTNVPILMTTSQHGPAEAERARRAGADGLLVKPFSPEAMVDAVRRIHAVTRAAGRRAGEAHADAERAKAGSRERGIQWTGRIVKMRAHQRMETVRPPLAPPRLLCPQCDESLAYERSDVGGVNRGLSEQWDDFTCTRCGNFQYRHRTRKPRPIA
jgi:CheY-like chemotaxis protein